MSNFGPAFEWMIRHEDYNLLGLVTSEPNGGKARFGINSLFHPEALRDGFYEMERDHALEYAQTLYIKDYWNGRGFATISDQRLATKLFDMAVNMGNGGEMRVLQKTLDIPITCIMDTATQGALSVVGDDFLNELVIQLKKHYQEICDSNPTRYDKVINGWLVRAGELPPI